MIISRTGITALAAIFAIVYLTAPKQESNTPKFSTKYGETLPSLFSGLKPTAAGLQEAKLVKMGVAHLDLRIFRSVNQKRRGCLASQSAQKAIAQRQFQHANLVRPAMFFCMGHYAVITGDDCVESGACKFQQWYQDSGDADYSSGVDGPNYCEENCQNFTYCTNP